MVTVSRSAAQVHQAERQQRPLGAGRDGLIDAGLELARAGGPDAVVLRAKHPLARIGTARKSLAPAATRFGAHPGLPCSTSARNVSILILRPAHMA